MNNLPAPVPPQRGGGANLAPVQPPIVIVNSGPGGGGGNPNPPVPPAPPQPPQNNQNQRRGLRWWGWILVIIAVLGAGVGGWFLHQRLNPQQVARVTVLPPLPPVSIPAMGQPGDKFTLILRGNLTGTPIVGRIAPLQDLEVFDPNPWWMQAVAGTAVVAKTRIEVIVRGGERGLIVKPSPANYLDRPGPVFAVGTLVYRTAGRAEWLRLTFYRTLNNVPDEWVQAGVLSQNFPSPAGPTYTVWGDREIPPTASAQVATLGLPGVDRANLETLVSLSAKTPMVFHVTGRGERVIAYSPGH